VRCDRWAATRRRLYSTAALAGWRFSLPVPTRRRPPASACSQTRRSPPHVIALLGPATALTSDDRSTAYLAARSGYLVVDLSTGHTAQVNVADAQNAEFTAIARRADGKLVLGSADGAVYTLAPETPSGGGTATVGNRSKMFAHVDALVTQGNTTVVLDRGQTSVTTIGADGHAQQTLRAGDGATTLAADPLGRVLVADTRGGELLVYGVDPLILRQAYPVRQAPYGLTGSRELAWVSQTASNIVIGYDLSTGIPVEKVRYQPCSNPTRSPLMKRRTPCTWCRGVVPESRSSSTRRVPVDRAAAESAARGLGHRDV
jgi:hypothetical protein